MYKKRVNDEMFKHNVNIFACFSFVWLKKFQWFSLKHILIQITIIVNNEPETCLRLVFFKLVSSTSEY